MQETVQGIKGPEDSQRQVRDRIRPQGLWFERLASKLPLPTWSRITVVTLAPAIGLWMLGSQIGNVNNFTDIPLVSVPLLTLNMLFLVFSSRFIVERAENLRQYAQTLSTERAPGSLRRVYSLRPVIILWAFLSMLTGLVFDPLVFRFPYTPFQSLMHIFVVSYLRFAEATFLWVLGYAMFSLYRWGNLPVRLSYFAGHPTLGLKPFGNASLQFVTLYVVGVFITFPPEVYLSEAVRVCQSVFFVLGAAIFLGPLLGLRTTLLEAKQVKMDWVRKRHRRVMELAELSAEAPLDAGIVNELVALDNIRRDIQQIHGWPFNPGIVVKLGTVIIIPLVLGLIASYLIRILQF